MAVALALGGTGCSASHGSALSGGYLNGGTFGISPLRPGDELGLLEVLLHNASHAPITLDSITVPGQGVGTVIQVVSIKIAPFTNQVTGGAFNTDPPVQWNRGQCGEQALRPVHGYRMTPGDNVNVFVLIKASGPGRYHVTRHVVDYTQGGTHYSQAVITGYTGSVRRNAPYIPPQRDETRCLKSTGARLLP